jgi:hypothetical protein
MSKKNQIDKQLFQEISDPSERIKNLVANAAGRRNSKY